MVYRNVNIVQEAATDVPTLAVWGLTTYFGSTCRKGAWGSAVQ